MSELSAACDHDRPLACRSAGLRVCGSAGLWVSVLGLRAGLVYDDLLFWGFNYLFLSYTALAILGTCWESHRCCLQPLTAESKCKLPTYIGSPFPARALSFTGACVEHVHTYTYVHICTYGPNITLLSSCDNISYVRRFGPRLLVKFNKKRETASEQAAEKQYGGASFYRNMVRIGV